MGVRGMPEAEAACRVTRALPVRPGESILSAEAGVSVSCELDGTLSIANTGVMDVTLVRLTPSGRRFLAQQLLESAAHSAEHDAVGDRCTHITH